MALLELTGGAPVTALLGMCKNAGKTTALTRLIRECAAAGVTAGLTSIGRDGESRDLVTDTEKPPIYMYAGMLAATAEELLPLSDVSREILAQTGVHTSLGEVVLFRARSDGFVQLAGPGIVEQLGPLRELFHAFGADRVLIDGALGRRSPAAGALDGCCILSTGASLDRDMRRVAEETAYAAELLTLPERPAPGESAGRFTLFRNGGAEALSDAAGLTGALRTSGGTVLLSGALTEAQAAAILRCGGPLGKLTLLARDGSRFLLRRETFFRLRSMGVCFAVTRGTRLAAVTVNPVSAYGWRFDREEFLETMRAAVRVPVVDVGRYDGTEL